MSHDGYLGRCSAIGFSPCGENVAWNQGYGLKRGNMETFIGWKNSQGHYDNMVGSAFTKVGYGYYECPDGKIYWTGLYGKPK